MDSKNTRYLILTIILLILSAFGVFLVFKINSSPLNLFLNTPEVTVTPTPVIEEIIPTEIPQISITPVASISSIKEKSNILKISDIQITFPESWKIISNTEKTAKILTDYKQYQVYLILDLEKNTTNAKNSYDTEGKTNAIKTQYGEVYSISSGGGSGMTGALLNNNKYIFQWDIESNQKPPAELDGVWRADSNITQKSLLDITKTVQSLTKIIPTATSTAKLTPTVNPIITPSPISSPSAQLNFSSSEDGFSVAYSSLRKLYQDKESTGNRYTFYNLSGNFAVHVAPSGTWAWTNTDRNFSAALIVSGQNTYRYDITTQTIVDLQSSTKNYTIQCIHNGKESLKTECETFIRSFQLL